MWDERNCRGRVEMFKGSAMPALPLLAVDEVLLKVNFVTHLSGTGDKFERLQANKSHQFARTAVVRSGGADEDIDIGQGEGGGHAKSAKLKAVAPVPEIRVGPDSHLQGTPDAGVGHESEEADPLSCVLHDGRDSAKIALAGLMRNEA